MCVSYDQRTVATWIVRSVMALATAVGLSEGGGVGKRTIWWLASFGKGLIRCKVWTGKQGDHFLWKACIPIKKASSNFMVAEAHHLLQSPSPIHAKRFSMFAEIKGWKLLRDNIYQLISTFLMLEYHVTHEIHFEIPKTLCHWVHWHLRRSVTIPLCQCNCDRCRCGRSASAS